MGPDSTPAAIHAAMQVPNPALHPKITAGAPRPPVMVPKVNPAAA